MPANWVKLMKIVFLAVPLLYGLWWMSIILFGWPYSYAALRQFSSSGLKTMKNSSEVKAYRVQFSSTDITKSNDRPETAGTINGYSIVKGPVALDTGKANQLQRLLVKKRLYDVEDSPDKLGFLPEYAIRWRGSDHVLSLLICPSCNQTESVMHDLSGRTLWQRRRQVSDLAEIKALIPETQLR